MYDIDFENDRFPYCIVWTPIPVLTWIFPFVGHLGICDSVGMVHDFAGPYRVGKDNMAFGRPTRYMQLYPQRCKDDEWDRAIIRADDIYSERMHNLCCDNCHSHVCTALDFMRYRGFKRWNMIIMAIWVFFFARYVSIYSFIKSWLPFLCILSIYLLATA